jgi:hypothetical protein
MILYKDPIIEHLISVIETACGDTFKSYHHGDPLLIAKSDLPALIITKDTTEIGDESNAEDYHKMIFVITVVYDIRDSLSDANIRVQAGDQALYNLMEGRDEDTWNLLSTSLIDVLRNNANLGNDCIIDLQTPMSVDYGFTVGVRAEKGLAYEAHLSFSLFKVQLR